MVDELPVSDIYLAADDLPVSDKVGISIWWLVTCLLVTELEFLFGDNGICF